MASYYSYHPENVNKRKQIVHSCFTNELVFITVRSYSLTLLYVQASVQSPPSTWWATTRATSSSWSTRTHCVFLKSTATSVCPAPGSLFLCRHTPRPGGRRRCPVFRCLQMLWLCWMCRLSSCVSFLCECVNVCVCVCVCECVCVVCVCEGV